MPSSTTTSTSLPERQSPVVVRFRPRLRVAPRPDSRSDVPPRPQRTGVLVRLDEWRASRDHPEKSGEGAWLVTAVSAMLLSILVWRLFLPRLFD